MQQIVVAVVERVVLVGGGVVVVVVVPAVVLVVAGAVVVMGVVGVVVAEVAGLVGEEDRGVASVVGGSPVPAETPAPTVVVVAGRPGRRSPGSERAKGGGMVVDVLASEIPATSTGNVDPSTGPSADGALSRMLLGAEETRRSKPARSEERRAADTVSTKRPETSRPKNTD